MLQISVHYGQGEEQEQAFIYQYHAERVWTVAWSPDGQSLASAGIDGEVHVWQAV